MGRPRRYIDRNGKLECPLCNTWKHISEFRCRTLIAGEARIEDIWFEEDGKEYGRPDGYCKPCASKRAQGPEVLARYLEDLRRKAEEEDEEGYDIPAMTRKILAQYAGMPGSTMQLPKDG